MAAKGSRMDISCAFCKRYLDHLDGKMNYFLKRMTADYRHSMIMPTIFVNHFGGKISGIIKLESPNGILYVVEVTEHKNKTVLRCGWEAFVDAHHIEENDSLLFFHIENSRFKVLILDSDDCEKVIFSAGIRNTSSIRERKTDSVDILRSSRDDTTESSGSKRCVTCQRGSSSQHRKTAKLAAASSSSEESGGDSHSECESLESDDLQTTLKPYYVLAPRSHLTEAQKEKVVALLQEIKPEITVFVAIMKKCHVQPPHPFVVITKEYAAAHFPHKSATVTLQRPGKSKKWHPRFYRRADRNAHMLRGRWLNFACDNHMQEGDICIFVPAKDGRRFTFMVYLFRGKATHSRGRTGIQRVGSSYGRMNTKIASAVHIKEEHTDGENISSENNRHGDESMEIEDSHGPSEPPYILPFNSHLSPLQKKIVEDKVQEIESESPIYVAIMKKTSVGVDGCFFLEFGARYADVHLPRGDQTMLLQQMGKIWRTEMRTWNGKRRRLLVGGWRKFVRDNHLRVGDICLFQLKKDERNLAMIVHIISREQC